MLIDQIGNRAHTDVKAHSQYKMLIDQIGNSAQTDNQGTQPLQDVNRSDWKQRTH